MSWPFALSNIYSYKLVSVALLHAFGSDCAKFSAMKFSQYTVTSENIAAFKQSFKTRVWERINDCFTIVCDFPLAGGWRSNRRVCHSLETNGISITSSCSTTSYCVHSTVHYYLSPKERIRIATNRSHHQGQRCKHTIITTYIHKHIHIHINTRVGTRIRTTCI